MLSRLFLFTAALSASALVAAQVPSISGAMTVNDFALQCQHFGMKSNPQARGDACLSWLKSSIEAVGQANRTSECWEDLERTAPLVVSDVLFHMATLPDDRKLKLPAATREVILLSAKRCK